ncbi:MAG: hypothetical protein JXB43_06315 [Dehalococcoidia bacterium]|nr:hypothetical protein [Dehalococcoidia bacterium]
MNKTVVAAILGAINAYMEQEGQGQAKTVPSIITVTPYPETSPWRLFGRQELMRARTNWQARRRNQRS